MALITPAEAIGRPRLLRTWAGISEYMGLSERQLQRYAKQEGLPVHRLGRHVVMVPEALSSWLIVREKEQRARRERRAG
jgi:hypothetical protein